MIRALAKLYPWMTKAERRLALANDAFRSAQTRYQNADIRGDRRGKGEALPAVMAARTQQLRAELGQ